MRMRVRLRHHRVCPTPIPRPVGSGRAASRPSNASSRPTARTVCGPPCPGPVTAIPAESYPRYSSRRNAGSKNSSAPPVSRHATIPHTTTPPRRSSVTVITRRPTVHRHANPQDSPERRNSRPARYTTTFPAEELSPRVGPKNLHKAGLMSIGMGPSARPSPDSRVSLAASARPRISHSGEVGEVRIHSFRGAPTVETEIAAKSGGRAACACMGEQD